MNINEEKAENTPAGGVLMGKKDGQTIIHDKGTMSGYLVGKLHKDGGIKAVNKATGQPLEMQGGEVIITAPAVSDQTKREFEGKMMTNREILSAINEKGGGVSFADGGDIPAKIHTTDCEYKLGGKVVKDTDIAHSLGMNSTLKKGKQQFSSGDTTYDVDAIYNAIKKGKLRLKTKEVETFPMKYPVYDKKYSETVKTDFRKPNGITVRTESGEEVLIDGNHRMNNAYLKGRKTMKTYYIEDPKQIAKFTKKNKFELGGENKMGGHLSSGKSLKQIAEMHNVSLAHINEQLAKGLEVEKEHFTDFKERTRVAKDHLVENPDYYTILEKAGLKYGGRFDNGGAVSKENEITFDNKSYVLKSFYKTNNPSIDNLLIEAQPFIAELIEKQKELVLKETLEITGVATPMSEFAIEQYEIGLIFKMVQSFNKYLKTTDILTDVTIKNVGLFEISAIVIRDDKKYSFITELIPAGGYNIQEFHYRYITKTNLPESRENSAIDNLKSKLSVFKKIQTIDIDINRYKKSITALEQQIKDGGFQDDYTNYFYKFSNENIERSKREIISKNKEIQKLEAKKNDLESVFMSLEKKGVGVNFGKEVKESIGRKLLIDRLNASKYKETSNSLEFKIPTRLIQGEKINENTYNILGEVNTFTFTDEGNGLCSIKAGLELRGKYTLYAEFNNVPLSDIRIKINEIFRGEFEKYLKYGGHIQRQELVDKSKKGDTPARDLNNYNDVMDLQADEAVGGESGLAFANGGSLDDYNFNFTVGKWGGFDIGDGEYFMEDFKSLVESKPQFFVKTEEFKDYFETTYIANPFDVEDLEGATDEEYIEMFEFSDTYLTSKLDIINQLKNNNQIGIYNIVPSKKTGKIEIGDMAWYDLGLNGLGSVISHTPTKESPKYEELMQLHKENFGYADGGITPIDANLEGDSVDIVESDFAKGGVVYDTTKPKIEKLTITRTGASNGSNRASVIGRYASTVSELQQIVFDYIGISPKQQYDYIVFRVNDNTRGNYYIELNKGKKNTVKNVNPETLNSLNFRRVIDAKTYLVKNYDWTDFFELGSQTPISTNKSASTSIQSQYPEYYEYVGNTVNSFTKGKIYKINYPNDLEAEGNFIDNNGYTDGFSGSNYEKFKPSTKEAFLLQQNFTSSNNSSSAEPKIVDAVNVEFIYPNGRIETSATINISNLKNALANFWNIVDKKSWEVRITPFENQFTPFAVKELIIGSDFAEFNPETFSEEQLGNKLKSLYPNLDWSYFLKEKTTTTTNASNSAQKFDFSSTKIDVSNNPDLSKKVQKVAFENGWEWENGGGKTIDYNDFNYMYFTKTSISYGYSPMSFLNSPKREITEADIFGSQASASQKPTSSQAPATDAEVFEISVGYKNDNTGNSGAKRKYSIKELYDFLKLLYEYDDKFSSVSILPYGKNFQDADLTYISIYDNFWKKVLEDLSEDDAKDAISKFLITSYPYLSFDDFANIKTTNIATKEKVKYLQAVNGSSKYLAYNITQLRDFIERLAVENKISLVNAGERLRISLTLNDDNTSYPYVIIVGENASCETCYDILTDGTERIKQILLAYAGTDEFDWSDFFEEKLTVQYKPIDLSQTKIWFGNDVLVSKQIQERAFELGWSWKTFTSPTSPNYVNEPALYFGSDKDITYGDDRQLFDSNKEFREITFKDLFEKLSVTSSVQTPTVSGSLGTIKEISDFKEAISVLEGISSQVAKKYNTENYEDNLQLLKEVKEEYELALSFTPESSFMYERIELMKKTTEIQKEITRISELKNGGAFYILSKVIERLEKGENWKELGKGEIMVNEVPEQEIDTIIYTEKFKNWFGDWEQALITKEYDYVSKALTESGKPCVMYHGAKRIKYSYRQVSNGVLYLAENKSYAEWFSENNSPYQKEGDYLTQCFVNLKNPIDLTPFGVEEVDLRDIIQYIDALYPLAKIYDVLEPPTLSLEIMNNNLIGLKVRAWNIIRQYPALNTHIRENTNYDGFIYYENNPSDKIFNEQTNQLEDKITKATAVFDSKQVKLVDAILFDGSLDDWRFETGGKVNN
jgi:hypothetical protein